MSVCIAGSGLAGLCSADADRSGVGSAVPARTRSLFMVRTGPGLAHGPGLGRLLFFHFCFPHAGPSPRRPYLWQCELTPTPPRFVPGRMELFLRPGVCRGNLGRISTLREGSRGEFQDCCAIPAVSAALCACPDRQPELRRRLCGRHAGSPDRRPLGHRRRGRAAGRALSPVHENLELDRGQQRALRRYRAGAARRAEARQHHAAAAPGLSAGGARGLLRRAMRPASSTSMSSPCAG